MSLNIRGKYKIGDSVKTTKGVVKVTKYERFTKPNGEDELYLPIAVVNSEEYIVLDDDNLLKLKS